MSAAHAKEKNFHLDRRITVWIYLLGIFAVTGGAAVRAKKYLNFYMQMSATNFDGK
jgi:hypothetical protein